MDGFNLNTCEFDFSEIVPRKLTRAGCGLLVGTLGLLAVTLAGWAGTCHDPAQHQASLTRLETSLVD